MKAGRCRLRIAVACSGLGHVQRGIEAWAADLFAALRRTGADVTLFAASATEGVEAVPCLRRSRAGAIGLAGGLRHLGGWRYGMGSAYDVEQSSFALALWWRIHSKYDILHVQDPLIALWLERARRRGLSRPRVIYANGTGEGGAMMRHFTTLQLLTPATFAFWQQQRGPAQTGFLIPNFIDTDRFRPGDQAAARAAFGLPADVPIVLCCAAIRRYHKRVDYLLEEFAAAGGEAMLVVAGAREVDTDALVALGAHLLGSRVRFLLDLPRATMPTLYQAADAFVLTSLGETFGIALIEAMASGLPVICNDTPDFHYVAGAAGLYADLSRPGGLAAPLAELRQGDRRAALAQAGRAQVLARFGADVVVREILAMYEAVAAGVQQ